MTLRETTSGEHHRDGGRWVLGCAALGCAAVATVALGCNPANRDFEELGNTADGGIQPGADASVVSSAMPEAGTPQPEPGAAPEPLPEPGVTPAPEPGATPAPEPEPEPEGDGGDSSAPRCEPGTRQDCWEDERGLPLPELATRPMGNCRYGSQLCSTQGTWGTCVGVVAPLPEDSCDVAGSDDDCNGVPNENCGCSDGESRECGTDVGNCELGLQTCDGSAWGPCEGEVAPASLDSCELEGDDADCNGVANEGCECVGTVKEPCGDCGARTCDPATGSFGACVGVPQTEACWETEDGEPLPGSAPDDPIGNCRAGERSCDDDGSWTECLGAVAAELQDSCDAPGDDADCDGITNAGCACVAGEVRSCGIDTGNCQQGEQTCGVDGWGDCVGQVAPAPSDSCAVAGDDADCDGTPNEGCACTSDAPDECDDDVSCTTDTCANGACSNEVDSGFCLIGGSCYAHNQVDPTNPCRYCDATVNRRAWTNASSTTSCDDGLWCNGVDTCNGAGQCSHQFPSGNRCTGSGVCDKTTCSESSQTCFEPSTKVCSTSTEDRCSSNDACGAKQQRRSVTKYCSGTSSGCDGSTVYGNTWNDVDQCGSDEVCSSATKTCVGELSCAATCDSSTGLCWRPSTPTYMSLSDGIEYCNDGTWAGRTNWRLPTAHEAIELFRGCQDGTETGNLADSWCFLTCNDPTDCPTLGGCGQCSGGEGPDTDPVGCYWNPIMEGDCTGFWTSTKQIGNYYWEAQPLTGSLFAPHMDTLSYIRCVVPE